MKLKNEGRVGLNFNFKYALFIFHKHVFRNNNFIVSLSQAVHCGKPGDSYTHHCSMHLCYQTTLDYGEKTVLYSW